MTNEQVNPEQIQSDTQKYFAAMVEAHAAGADFADFIDSAGMDALTKITASAGSVANFGRTADTAAPTPMMNGFVPTVTEIDGSGRPIGYDLFSRLMKDRIVLLQGEVNATMASIACASLLFLAHIDKDNAPLASGEKAPPIQVYIDSPGGSVLAGLAIYDTMRSISAEITTVGMGMQASMGSILLAAGDVRKMTRSSKLMIHQISGGTEGKASAQEVGMAFTEQLHEDLKSIYVRHIGLTHEFFDLALEHDTWLTAEQALKIGFISEIIVGDRKRTAYEAESIRTEFQKARDAKVPKTADGIIAVLNNVSAKGGEAATIRGELVTALSQYDRFWTEAKKAEVAAKTAAAAPANDDVPVAKTAPKKKGAGGPTPS